MIGLCCLFIAFKQYRQRTLKVVFDNNRFTSVDHWSMVWFTTKWSSVLIRRLIRGSLLFFEHGAHHLWLTNPSMPIEQTIAIDWCAHSYLWVTVDFIIFPTFVASITNVPSFAAECPICPFLFDAIECSQHEKGNRL